MQEFKLAPLSSSFVDYAVENVNKNDRIEAEQGSVLTTIMLTKINYDCDYAYAFIKGREYNMQKCHDDSIGEYYYELIITNENTMKMT